MRSHTVASIHNWINVFSPIHIMNTYISRQSPGIMTHGSYSKEIIPLDPEEQDAHTKKAPN